MKSDELLKDPAAALTASVQQMRSEAHDAVRAFHDAQAKATLEQNAAAKADLAVLKSSELVRLKARLPNVGERLAAVAVGLRDRMDKNKTAAKALDAAIEAFGKQMAEPRD